MPHHTWYGCNKKMQDLNFVLHANAHISFLHIVKKLKQIRQKPKEGTRVMLGDTGTLSTQIHYKKKD